MGLRPAAAAAAAGVLVGAGIVATRVVVHDAGPASLALLRYVIGACCLLPPALLTARVRFDRRDLAAIALLGIVQFGVLIALLNYGLRSVPSGRAALIFATLPLLAMVLAAALGRERLTALKAAGVVLTIAGVGLALADRAAAAAAGGAGPRDWTGPGGWAGDAAVFASALSGAITSVLYRPYVEKYPTLTVGAVAMVASVGFLALLAVGEGFFHAPPRFAPGGWLAVVFIGISSGAGYYLWLWALGHTTPTRVTVFLALSPITAAALGAWLLAEPVSGRFALGLLGVVLGLWLAHA